MIICGLIAIVLQSKELAVASEQTRVNFREPLARVAIDRFAYAC